MPILTAYFYAMEARALAGTGDADACDRAMGAAVDHFGRHVTGDGPDWIDSFDAAELAAELGHCHRDLGRPDRAIEHATDALASASGDHARSDFLAAMVLADAHVDRGDLDERFRVAAQAIAVGDTVASTRCRSYVDEFKQRLRGTAPARDVRAFVTQVRESRLWAPSRL